eukprot:TRINITY_DN779968_c0_g1_i1.p1 TRINITY_DN779968_c0_g1~~TRINITY_DN779968_c0_g1_i1.p1  ORF type:complete len:310 (+),score=87.55 TRINITY_DN779968_c0_g1_i1:88-1017(+)
MIKSILVCLAIFSVCFAGHLMPPSKVRGYSVVVGATGLGYQAQSSAYRVFAKMSEDEVPYKNRILMSPDDVAFSAWNREFIGQIFNDAGMYAPNVRPATHHIDYRGDDCNPMNFLNILRNEKIVGAKSNRTLTTGPEDTIFVYLAASVSTNSTIGFGATDEYGKSWKMESKDLMDTLKYMHENKLYKKMVFFLQSNEAAAFFSELTSDMNILVIAATSDHDGKYVTTGQQQDENCDQEVHGDLFPVCLGFQFSTAFMKKYEFWPYKITIKDLVAFANKQTSYHNAQLLGDLSIAELPMYDFLMPNFVPS